jgi:Spy/CpxP family protein refolding chaperone
MNDRPRPFWITRRAWLGGAALGLVGLGAAGVAASPPGLLAHARHGFGHFRGHHGHGPHALGEEDVRFTVEWLLREADASDEQVAAVTAIATRTATDLVALHDAHRSRRDAFTAALVAADRTALESLRGEEVAALQSASQRLVTALADAAEVLTPEQRQRLADAHAAHHRGE